MTRYLIFVHYEPINKGDGVEREVQNWFSGVGGTLLNNSYEARTLTENDVEKLRAWKWQVKEYGYKSLSTARRGLKAHESTASMENTFGGWHVSCKIVEVDLAD